MTERQRDQCRSVARERCVTLALATLCVLLSVACARTLPSSAAPPAVQPPLSSAPPTANSAESPPRMATSSATPSNVADTTTPADAGPSRSVDARSKAPPVPKACRGSNLKLAALLSRKPCLLHDFPNGSTFSGADSLAKPFDLPQVPPGTLEPQQLPDGLVLRAKAAPRVRSGGRVVVRISIINTASTTIRFWLITSSLNRAAFTLHLYDNRNRRVRDKVSRSRLCNFFIALDAPVFVHVALEPGGRLRTLRALHASRYVQSDKTCKMMPHPLQRGRYTVRVFSAFNDQDSFADVPVSVR